MAVCSTQLKERDIELEMSSLTFFRVYPGDEGGLHHRPPSPVTRGILAAVRIDAEQGGIESAGEDDYRDGPDGEWKCKVRLLTATTKVRAEAKRLVEERRRLEEERAEREQLPPTSLCLWTPFRHLGARAKDEEPDPSSPPPVEIEMEDMREMRKRRRDDDRSPSPAVFVIETSPEETETESDGGEVESDEPAEELLTEAEELEAKEQFVGRQKKRAWARCTLSDFDQTAPTVRRLAEANERAQRLQAAVGRRYMSAAVHAALKRASDARRKERKDY